MSLSRRTFLQSSSAALASATVAPYFFSTPKTLADETKAKNDRPLVGCIGLGGMGNGDARSIKRYGDIVAVCDVDRNHAEAAAAHKEVGEGKAGVFEDYRKLLERKDI